MCISLLIAGLAAVGTVAAAEEQRSAAKAQAAAMAEQARQASAQAAEAARGSALAAQTAAERQAAEAVARQNEKDAAMTETTPTVQVAAQDPVEVARRRSVRATFTAEDNGTSIRL